MVQCVHSEYSVEGSDDAKEAAKSVSGGEAAASLGSKGSAWVTTCKVVNRNKHKGKKQKEKETSHHKEGSN